MESIKRSLFILILPVLGLLSYRVSAIYGLTPNSLKIVVNQDASYNLTVEDVALDELLPSDYKINYPTNYYTVKVLGPGGTELFSGKVVHTEIIYNVPPLPGETAEPPLERRLDRIRLYLPYFADAEKVQFFDENDNLKLEINLSDYGIEPPPATATVTPGGPTPTWSAGSGPFETCDRCGRCEGQPIPPGWAECRACHEQGGKWTVVGCVGTEPGSFVRGLLRIIFSLAGGIGFLALLYGGGAILTSKGSPEQLEKGKSVLRGAIVGILLVFFSVFILQFLGITVFNLPGFGR